MSTILSILNFLIIICTLKDTFLTHFCFSLFSLTLAYVTLRWFIWEFTNVSSHNIRTHIKYLFSFQYNKYYVLLKTSYFNGDSKLFKIFLLFFNTHYYYCKPSSHLLLYLLKKGNVFIYLIPFMFKALKYSVRMTLR